ncbi:MAG: hypothetical protein ABIP29_08850, partial [Candidatus Eisenbacteria bacterium]
MGGTTGTPGTPNMPLVCAAGGAGAGQIAPSASSRGSTIAEPLSAGALAAVAGAVAFAADAGVTLDGAAAPRWRVDDCDPGARVVSGVTVVSGGIGAGGGVSV